MFHGRQEHNKNILRLETFKNGTLSLIKILLVLINKDQMHWTNLKIHTISDGRNVNKLSRQNI